MSEEQLTNEKINLNQVKEIKWPSTDTGGVMPMSIESRFAHERHRLNEDYTEKWKAYRMKYIKSLILERKEPRDVPGLRKEFYNPIRRFFHIPLNYYEKFAIPYLGKHYARASRNGIAILGTMYCATLYFYYWFTYSDSVNTWTNYNTLTLWSNRPEILPGDPLYPLENPKPYDWQFADRGFSKRKSHLNI